MGRQTTVVTSFRHDQYETYGQRFLESFNRLWPVDVRRIFFYEGGEPQWPELEQGWDCLPLYSITDWAIFDAKIPFKIMRGWIDEQTYTINHDATMCRKIYMQMCLPAGRGICVWLDADTVTHSPVTHDFLGQVLPDNKLCAYLGRDGVAPFYTESGFIAFNTNHPAYDGWRELYLGFVNEGLNFTMPGWHDCFVFDAVRRLIGEDHFINLGAGVQHNGHVFINSILGSVMDHMKGPRKQLGRSRPNDLVTQRQEDYWNAKASQPGDQGGGSAAVRPDPTGAV